MDLARSILLKYGWKEGDGLGKNKDGISKPLRAALKFDKAGLGVDQAAADFNNHWWERVFNEATANVNITDEGSGIKLSLKDEENSVEISTKDYSVQKLKKLKQNLGQSHENKKGYNNFLQAATLNNLGNEIENPNKIAGNDIDVSKIKVLTDEELFNACGGRTAHKGARHGLKLSGKLSRIERQEAELLAQLMAAKGGFNKDKDRKKILKTSTKAELIEKQWEDELMKIGEVGEKTEQFCEMLRVKSSKPKKKKRKRCDVESADAIETAQKLVSESKQKMIVSKHAEIVGTNAVETLNWDIISGKNNDNKTNSAKKKKNRHPFSNNIDEIVHKKRKKKNKQRN